MSTVGRLCDASLSLPSSSSLPPVLQAKKAIKEVPKDDEEVERQEEGEIDRGFTESSSSSEDELTEAGQYGRELMTPLHMGMYCWTSYLLLCTSHNMIVFE